MKRMKVIIILVLLLSIGACSKGVVEEYTPEYRWSEKKKKAVKVSKKTKVRYFESGEKVWIAGKVGYSIGDTVWTSCGGLFYYCKSKKEESD